MVDLQLVAVVNLDDEEDVFDDVVDDVYVIDVDDLLDDKFVEADVVDLLDDVVVVASIMSVVVTVAMCDENAVDDNLAVDVMSEPLVGNDEDEDEVDV